MANKIKILYFVDRMLYGGIQGLLINWVKNFDKNKFQIDFLLLDDGKTYQEEENLRKLGCNVYKLEGVWIRKITDFFKYAKKLDEFFKNNNEYKVIHLHSSSKNYMVLKYAKKYDIPVRIAHSHNIGFQTNKKVNTLIGNFFKILLKKYATNYFACSEKAGQWLFGKKELKRGNIKIIHNAIDLEKFEFNEDKRKELRNKLKIQDKLVIGHVGRFTNQKNHTFLIDIFNEIHKINKNTVLLLVGIGEKQDEIYEKVQQLKIEDSVLFIGFTNNVNEYMWAMDLFVFPSLFEGLGIVLIEAQATGMQCFTSKDVVPKEANVSGLLNYIHLKEEAKTWAKEILKYDGTRKDVIEQIRNKKYDIEDIVKELEYFYLNS